ncbi:glycosyltransferase [Gimesia aquarii]|uniref:Glycosyltransferase EpsF n=1 Tax=Gimesia aquarii TaxID=2527964 RepID=A0A517WW98_9PLAN|nr:glycosyltransferase [Gimesia aquarii]QDU09537.1 Putative glycosyltransferase EpsF [Gimesia aquarii]
MSDDVFPTPIAFCITGLQPGGAERALVQIVKRLNREKWSPVVYSLTGTGPLADELQLADIPIEVLHAHSPWDARIIWRLAKKFKAQKPVLLQTFLFHANLAGRLAARISGIRHVVSGIRVSEKRQNGHLFLDRWTNGLVDLNVCVSQSVAQFSIRQGKLSKSKVKVIPNGVDFELFDSAEAIDLSPWGIPAGAKVILFVGRLDPQKAPNDLLTAFTCFAEQAPDFHLLFVGEGPLKAKLEQQSYQLPCASRIHFAGWQSQIPQLMKAASCLVLPSLWEGMPNVVLEAMASGLPVISTDVDGVSELIQHGKQGVLVAQGSSAEIQQALRDFSHEPAMFLEMARNAQIIVKKEFTWEAIAQKYDQIYENLLIKHR